MACTIWACYIRTAGIALVAAVAAWLFLRRDFRRGLLFVGGTFICWLPWALRNQAVGGGGVVCQAGSSWSTPTIRSRAGSTCPVSSSGFIGQVDRYLRGWPELLVPSFGGTDTILHPAPLLLIVLAAAATVLCIRRGEHLLLLYAAFFMGMVLLWFWPGERFLVPVVPVVVLLGVWVVAADPRPAGGDGQGWIPRGPTRGMGMSGGVAHRPRRRRQAPVRLR